MPEWLKILLAALGGSLVGGTVSGTFLLVADYLRHKRTRIELYQQVLTEKRIAACNDLLRMIVEVHRNLAHGVNPAELLRWPKDPGALADLPEAEIKRSRRVDERIGELTRFVATNRMLLAPQVLRAWYSHYGALGHLQLWAKAHPQDDALVEDALENLLDPSFDEICTAVKRELQGAGIEFHSSSEIGGLVERGIEKADRLLAEAGLMAAETVND